MIVTKYKLIGDVIEALEPTYEYIEDAQVRKSDIINECRIDLDFVGCDFNTLITIEEVEVEIDVMDNLEDYHEFI